MISHCFALKNLLRKIILGFLENEHGCIHLLIKNGRIALLTLDLCWPLFIYFDLELFHCQLTKGIQLGVQCWLNFQVNNVHSGLDWPSWYLWSMLPQVEPLDPEILDYFYSTEGWDNSVIELRLYYNYWYKCLGNEKVKKIWGKKWQYSEYLGSPYFGYTKGDLNTSKGFSEISIFKWYPNPCPLVNI